MLQWACVNTKPQQEVRAAIEITNQGFSVFFPVEKRTKKKAGEEIVESYPLFPRYIFVRLDRERSEWGSIRNTRGVSYLLTGSDYKPLVVSDSIIEAIRAYMPATQSESSEPTVFQANQKVKIVEGPLAGIEGLFVADKQRRVMALLDVLGKRVEVPQKSIVAA